MHPSTTFSSLKTLTKSSIVAIIPARYASSRLPGKALIDLAGKPMIEHVYKRASSVPELDAVVVATVLCIAMVLELHRKISNSALAKV